MGRQYISWGNFDEMEKATGLKPKSKPEPSKKEAEAAAKKLEKRQQKFARCRACKGLMQYVPGTNILICENEVEKKVTVKNEDGTTTEKVEVKRCGNINLVADEYMGYVDYLFGEAK